MINGFLPCGLVYSFLAIAFATGHLWHGAAVMACFGLGTIPALATLGVGVTALPCRARQRVLRLGGVAMMVVAALMIYRGGMALAFPTEATTCPLCAKP
jgi:sulfite exporter TauE/SafE